MNRDKIRQAQAAGWVIERVTGDKIVCKCPAHGCGLKVQFRETDEITNCDPEVRRERIDIPIGTADDLRKVLRERREDLCLTIMEVEDVAGLTHGHLGKMEKDNPSREPQLDTILLWLNSLGFELVIRPGELPSKAIGVISDTRGRADIRARQRMRRDGRTERGSREL